MNKREARNQIDQRLHTWDDLQTLVNAAKDEDRPSRVNPQFTISETCKMYAAMFEGKDMADTPDPFSQGMSCLAAANVLRDCA